MHLKKHQILSIASRLLGHEAKDLEPWLMTPAAEWDEDDEMTAMPQFHAGEDGRLHLDIYGPIVGEWEAIICEIFGIRHCNPTAMQAALAMPEHRSKVVVMHIHSPGGTVMGASLVTTALESRMGDGRSVVAIIEGAAVSAAAMIAIKAGTIYMGEMAVLSFHRPVMMGCVVMSARELERMTNEYRSIEEQFGRTIAAASGAEAQTITRQLRNYDFITYSRDEAMEAGFKVEAYAGQVQSPAPAPAAGDSDKDEGKKEEDAEPMADGDAPDPDKDENQKAGLDKIPGRDDVPATPEPAGKEDNARPGGTPPSPNLAPNNEAIRRANRWINHRAASRAALNRKKPA